MKKSFNAAHARIGEIWVENGKCDVCNEDKPCLNIDSSEDEYGAGKICKKCIKDMFDLTTPKE